jgi:uncharacterized protein YciI
VLGLHLARTSAAGALVQPSAPAAKPAPAPPMVAATRPVIRHTHGEQLAWQAKLGRLQVSGGGLALSAGPLEEAVVYARDGRPVVRVTARSIRGQAQKRDFVVEGPVWAVAERGAIVEAQRVEWYDAQARLHCVGPLTARFRNAMATAPAADLLVEQDLLKVPGQVRLYLGSNLVVGQQLTYNYARDSFVLVGVRMILHAREAKEELQKLRE